MVQSTARAYPFAQLQERASSQLQRISAINPKDVDATLLKDLCSSLASVVNLVGILREHDGPAKSLFTPPPVLKLGPELILQLLHTAGKNILNDLLRLASTNSFFFQVYKENKTGLFKTVTFANIDEKWTKQVFILCLIFKERHTAPLTEAKLASYITTVTSGRAKPQARDIDRAIQIWNELATFKAFAPDMPYSQLICRIFIFLLGKYFHESPCMPRTEKLQKVMARLFKVGEARDLHLDVHEDPWRDHISEIFDDLDTSGIWASDGDEQYLCCKPIWFFQYFFEKSAIARERLINQMLALIPRWPAGYGSEGYYS